MKNYTYIFLITFLCVNSLDSYGLSEESGGFKDNGGHSCEIVIERVADDLKNWLENGVAKKLTHKESITTKEYEQKMLDAITNVQNIRCSDGIIELGKAEKECRNFKDADGAWTIECDKEAINFLNNDLGQENLYLLIHHEYAGIAGLESNLSVEKSNYFYTKQISSSLKKYLLKKMSDENGGNCSSKHSEVLSIETELQAINFYELKEKFLQWEKSVLYDEVVIDDRGESFRITIIPQLSTGSLNRGRYSMTFTRLNYNNLVLFSLLIDSVSSDANNFSKNRETWQCHQQSKVIRSSANLFSLRDKSFVLNISMNISRTNGEQLYGFGLIISYDYLDHNSVSVVLKHFLKISSGTDKFFSNTVQ